MCAAPAPTVAQPAPTPAPPVEAKPAATPKPLTQKQIASRIEAEKREALKNDIALAKEFEAEVAAQLAVIEEHLYEQEETYQEETPHGSVVRGWEGFLDVRPTTDQKRRIEDLDRIFSASSYTFQNRNPHLYTGPPAHEAPAMGSRKRPATQYAEKGIQDPSGHRKKRKMRATAPARPGVAP